MQRKINVFACGGFGTNIVSHLIQGELFSKMSEIVSVYALDTSSSNLRRFDGTKFSELVERHLVPGKDGSGMVRATNINEITQLVTDIVNKGLDYGLNLIVYSASGGSGGVIGPELHEALLKKGLPTISVVLETDDSIQAVENTLKTLKTQQYKASIGTRQFDVYWGMNRQADGSVSQEAANNEFIGTLEDFLVLGHPFNHEIDSKDLETFLDYTLAPGDKPVVRFLSCLARNDREDPKAFVPSNGSVPVTSLSILAERGGDPLVVSGVGAHFTGYLADDLAVDPAIEIQYQIHGGLSAKKSAELSTIITNHRNVAEKYREQAAGDQLVAGKNDQQSDGGTFL